MERRNKQREGRLRGKYPEVYGKVVDFITHTIDDGTLYLQSISRTRRVSAFVMLAICSPLELNSAIGRAETSTSSAST
jgi:hypothetical protein